MNDYYTSPQLFTSRDNLQNLYGVNDKIIVSAFDIDYLKCIPILEFDVYTYSQQDDKGIILSFNSQIKNDDNNLIELQLTPIFYTNFVAFTTAAKQELTQLIDRLKIKDVANLYSLIELEPQQEPAKIQAYFWQQLYQRTQQETKTIALRNAELQKEFLQLRTLHENMQNAFATVEDYLTQAKLPELQLAFDNQPINKLIQPGNVAQSNALTIKQLLPVSSRGIAMIDLRVANTDHSCLGYLDIQLKYSESKASFAQWQVPYRQLSPGWLSLDLPQIDIGRKKDVELIINWQTESGAAPSLILAAEQLIPELRAFLGEQTISHSLAFRVWRGLPGTRKITSSYLNSDAPKLGWLGQGVMAGVKEITAQANDKFAHVQAINHGSKIMTHPRANGDATVAILPFSFPLQANYLTATVITEHPQADKMEYALAIVSKEVSQATHPDRLLSESIAYSDWIEVEPNTTRQITLFLEHPPANHSQIAIAARLAKESKADCAWCRWLNFKIESRLHNPQNLKPQTLRNASLDSNQAPFPRVQQLDDKGKIQVHPWNGIDTVAVLSNAVPQDTAQIKAIVCTPNEAADTIEYAMAVIQQDDDTQARLAVSNPQTAVASTGWHQVSANTPYRLNLKLPQPTTSQSHLILTTRVSQTGTHSHGWARWLEIKYAHQSTD